MKTYPIVLLAVLTGTVQAADLGFKQELLANRNCASGMEENGHRFQWCNFKVQGLEFDLRESNGLTVKELDRKLYWIASSPSEALVKVNKYDWSGRGENPALTETVYVEFWSGDVMRPSDYKKKYE